MDKAKVRKLLHDINSPLTSIMGYADLLKRHGNKGIPFTEKEFEWMDRIKEEALRVGEMVKKISGELKDES